jgi:glucose/arabinose dehydrogenase
MDHGIAHQKLDIKFWEVTTAEDFITGWLQGEKVVGRPSAPFVMSDGSLLISDDKANVIYRIAYKQ